MIRLFTYFACALQLSPSIGAIVCNDLFEHGAEGGSIERLALADSHGSSVFVVVPAGDNAFRVGDYTTIIKENVNVVFRGQQGADVALEHEVWLASTLD